MAESTVDRIVIRLQDGREYKIYMKKSKFSPQDTGKVVFNGYDTFELVRKVVLVVNMQDVLAMHSVEIAV